MKPFETRAGASNFESARQLSLQATINEEVIPTPLSHAAIRILVGRNFGGRCWLEEGAEMLI